MKRAPECINDAQLGSNWEHKSPPIFWILHKTFFISSSRSQRDFSPRNFMCEFEMEGAERLISGSVAVTRLSTSSSKPEQDELKSLTWTVARHFN